MAGLDCDLRFGILTTSKTLDSRQMLEFRKRVVRDPCANDRHLGVFNGHSRSDPLSIYLGLFEGVLVLTFFEGAR
jgi:hypothetical protein